MEHHKCDHTKYATSMQRSSIILLFTIAVLSVLTIVIWTGIFAAPRELRVTFLNVGQGDAIFVESPSGVQMLVDAGKNRQVIRELGRVVSLFDRSIDVVLATHPDADHIGGLPDVFKRYDVDLVIESSVADTEGVDATALENAVSHEEGARRIVATRGQVIDLGSGVTVEILFPDRAVSHVETNTGSVIAMVRYGATSFLLTGDAPKEIEEYLVRLDGERLDSTVLKAGHHGSRTSSALSFVGFASPDYAIFSRGCDNSYGHPHDEPRAVFARFDIETLDTCTDGRIAFQSDGVVVSRK